jgi:hypothetical protein
MDASNPVDIQRALGEVEDLLGQTIPAWANAAGNEARFAVWERTMYLATKAEMSDHGAFEKGETETSKKDKIERRLRELYPDEYSAHQDNAQLKAKGDAIFKGLDTRRSIGQTLLRAHMEADKPQHYGSGQRNG